MEAFAHPFGDFIELSKGLEDVQENVVTGEFLVCVMPSCGSVPRHKMWDVFAGPQLFISPHRSGGSSDAGTASHQNEAELKSLP